LTGGGGPSESCRAGRVADIFKQVPRCRCIAVLVPTSNSSHVIDRRGPSAPVFLADERGRLATGCRWSSATTRRRLWLVWWGKRRLSSLVQPISHESRGRGKMQKPRPEGRMRAGCEQTLKRGPSRGIPHPSTRSGEEGTGIGSCPLSPLAKGVGRRRGRPPGFHGQRLGRRALRDCPGKRRQTGELLTNGGQVEYAVPWLWCRGNIGHVNID